MDWNELGKEGRYQFFYYKEETKNVNDENIFVQRHVSKTQDNHEQ